MRGFFSIGAKEDVFYHAKEDIFYRAKEDGAVVLGLVHPWDAHGHHDDDDHTFSKEGIGELPTLDDDGEGGEDGH